MLYIPRFLAVVVVVVFVVVVVVVVVAAAGSDGRTNGLLIRTSK